MKWTRSFNVVKVLLLAVVVAGLSASLASAEEFQVKFTLPFEARWGSAVLPAGDYSLNLDTDKSPCVAIVRQGRQNLAMVVGYPQTEQREVAGPTALIAVRSGGEYTIRELHLAKAGVVLEYMAPKAEPQNLAQASQLILRVPVSMTGK
ncbi:MAG: hypothetical protein ABSD45_23280 [Terriglobia bacterium]|jgi:hypothetical protein